MKIVKLSSKNQITLPVSSLSLLGIQPKSRLLVEEDKEKIVLKPLKRSVVDETAGSLSKYVPKSKLGKDFKEIMEETKRNVFIRYFTQDVPTQYQEARKILERIENGELSGKVSILVINETIWILENFYKISRTTYLPQFLKVLALPGIKIVEVKKQTILEILREMAKYNIDFTDLYLIRTAARSKIFSFDKDLKLAT